MTTESKRLSDFTFKGPFKLNSYLLYLFDQCNKNARSQPKMIKELINHKRKLKG